MASTTHLQVILAVQVFMCLVNMTLHSVGVKILYELSNKKRKPQQMLLIMHLSLSELLMTSLELVNVSFKFYEGSHGDSLQNGSFQNSSSQLVDIQDGVPQHGSKQHVSSSVRGTSYVREYELSKYLNIVQLTFCYWVYHMMMIYITLDRFFHFYFPFRYGTIFTRFRTKLTCALTWLFSLAAFVVVATMNEVHTFDFKYFAYGYMYPALEVLFLICAGFSYGYIAHVVRHHNNFSVSRTSTRTDMRRHRSQDKIIVPRNSLVRKADYDVTDDHVILHTSVNISHIRQNMRLYIPTLLVVTFVLFMVLPDIVYLVYIIHFKQPETQAFQAGIWMTYSVSFTSDAVIYVFLQEEVRQELMRRFPNCCLRLC